MNVRDMKIFFLVGTDQNKQTGGLSLSEVNLVPAMMVVHCKDRSRKKGGRPRRQLSL